MDRPRRESRQHNGITLRGLSQLTFATKSANYRPWPRTDARISSRLQTASVPIFLKQQEFCHDK
jgi:hypothetical protein